MSVPEIWPQLDGQDVEPEVSPFRSATDWARLRATDIDRYRSELGQALEHGGPGA